MNDGDMSRLDLVAGSAGLNRNNLTDCQIGRLRGLSVYVGRRIRAEMNFDTVDANAGEARDGAYDAGATDTACARGFSGVARGFVMRCRGAGTSNARFFRAVTGAAYAASDLEAGVG